MYVIISSWCPQIRHFEVFLCLLEPITEPKARSSQISLEMNLKIPLAVDQALLKLLHAIVLLNQTGLSSNFEDTYITNFI